MTDMTVNNDEEIIIINDKKLKRRRKIKNKNRISDESDENHLEVKFSLVDGYGDKEDSKIHKYDMKPNRRQSKDDSFLLAKLNTNQNEKLSLDNFKMDLMKFENVQHYKNNIDIAKMSYEMYFPRNLLQIKVFTWNMSNVSNFPESFEQFIDSSSDDIKFYLFAFQETSSNTSQILEILQNTLGQEFIIYHSQKHGYIFSVLMGNRTFIWNLRIIGNMGLSVRTTPITKGVVAISFQFFGSTFLFLNSHLSSENFISPIGDIGRYTQRIEDYHKIVNSKELLNNLIDLDSKDKNTDDLFANFNYVIWAGDFNFRLDMAEQRLLHTIDNYRKFENPFSIEQLMEKDELLHSQIEGETFQEFEEARIQFLPTYKFKPGSEVYVGHRKPAFTDRILYRSNCSDIPATRCIDCVSYTSCMQWSYSDHKPVRAHLVLILRPHQRNLPFSGRYDMQIYNKFNSSERLLQSKQSFIQSKSESLSFNNNNSSSTSAVCLII